MEVVRTKFTSDSIFMKRLVPKFEVEESKIKKQSLGKYFIYENEFGIVDIDRFNDYQLGQYLVDTGSELLEMIKEIHFKDGFKFKHVGDLRKHTIAAILSTCKTFPKDTVIGAVEYYYEKKWRSYQERSKRFLSKAFANQDIWNRFATFTYDSSLMDEATFLKRLKKFLAEASCKGTKYQGIVERSDDGRLHFHCLMSCTDKFIEYLNLQEEEYFNKKRQRRETANVSVTLKERFGRCDFEPLDSFNEDFKFLLFYLCKYILKQDNKIIYSRGLPDELVCEIDDLVSNSVGYLTPTSTFLLMKDDIKFKLCQSTNINTNV